MTKIGRFNFNPYAGAPGTEKVSISAEKFTGRTAPAAAKVQVRKQNGGLENNLTVSQLAAASFFKIDRITSTQLSSGETNIIVECSGNVPLKNIKCGGNEYVGLAPTKNSGNKGGNIPWEVTYGGENFNFTPQTTGTPHYGVTFAKVVSGLDFIGETSSYTLKAYLTAPKNDGVDAISYDFLFGVYSGELNVPVSSIIPSGTLAVASKSVGPIRILPPQRGYIKARQNYIPLTDDNTVEKDGWITVYVDASEPWVVENTYDPWIVIRMPETAVGEIAGYFEIAATGPNTSGDTRDDSFRVSLVSNESIWDNIQVSQGEAAAERLWIQAGEGISGAGVEPNGVGEVSENGAYCMLYIRSNCEFTWNESELPVWIHKVDETATGTADNRNTLIELRVSAIQEETREFTFVATSLSESATSSFTLRQVLPDSVRTVNGEALTGGNSTFRILSEGVYGNYVELVLDRGDTTNYKEVEFAIEATGPWTLNTSDTSFCRNVRVLKKTDTSLKLGVFRNSAVSQFNGYIALFTGGVIRADIHIVGY